MWDVTHSIAKDEKFRKFFSESYNILKKNNLNETTFMNAWLSYITDINNGIEYPSGAENMMSGFMLGMRLSDNFRNSCTQ